MDSTVSRCSLCVYCMISATVCRHHPDQVFLYSGLWCWLGSQLEFVEVRGMPLELSTVHHLGDTIRAWKAHAGILYEIRIGLELGAQPPIEAEKHSRYRLLQLRPRVTQRQLSKVAGGSVLKT